MTTATAPAPPPPATSTRPPPPLLDIDTCPTLLLAALYAARVVGDPILESVCRRRLQRLDVHVRFLTADEGARR